MRVLPLPASARAEQPLIDVPPSVKLTLPVGAEPVTLAVKVTLAPDDAGFSELASDVVVAADPTTCAKDELLDPALFALPP